MTTSTTSTSPSAGSRVPLRVRLGQATSSPDADGAWWPQSRDLQAECADLIDNLTDTAYVNRLLFSRPDWDDVVTDGRGVRRIRARRGPVKVGSFPGDDTKTMVLLLSTGTRLRLRVIASDADPDEAEREFRAFAPSTDVGASVPAQ